jgi:tetratricopeptide (TPR) repeat protein
MNPKNDYAYANRGIARFLSGDFAGAESDFEMCRRVASKWARVYPDLELLLARLREAKETGAKPSGDAVKFEGDLTQWPGQIVAYYLGIISREAVLHAAQAGSGSDSDRRQKLCQAYFFIGEHALIEGNREEAMELLQKGIDTEARSDPEYAWAQGEQHNLRSLGSGDLTHENEAMSPNAQDRTTGRATVETPASSETKVMQSKAETERYAADPAAIHSGFSTREEVRRDWACCDAHVVSDRLFVGTVLSKHEQMKYLFVEFDEKGVVSNSHLASPDDVVRDAVLWARTTREPLDLSRQMQITPSVTVFTGRRLEYLPGPIKLYPNGIHIDGDGTGFLLKPSQLSNFRQCGELKISLHHLCGGFGRFGVDIDAETPGTQIDVSGLPEIGSHLHILMKVADLFLFVRYLQQTAPTALGGNT